MQCYCNVPLKMAFFAAKSYDWLIGIFSRCGRATTVILTPSSGTADSHKSPGSSQMLTLMLLLPVIFTVLSCNIHMCCNFCSYAVAISKPTSLILIRLINEYSSASVPIARSTPPAHPQPCLCVSAWLPGPDWQVCQLCNGIPPGTGGPHLRTNSSYTWGGALHYIIPGKLVPPAKQTLLNKLTLL